MHSHRFLFIHEKKDKFFYAFVYAVSFKKSKKYGFDVFTYAFSYQKNKKIEFYAVIRAF